MELDINCNEIQGKQVLGKMYKIQNFIGDDVVSHNEMSLGYNHMSYSFEAQTKSSNKI